MSDRYSQLVNLPVAGDLAKRIGLPQPVPLDRYAPGDPLVTGRVLLGGAGRVAGAVARVLAEAGVDSATALDDPVRDVVAEAGLDAAVFNPQAPADQRFKALVFDATGIERSEDLVELQRFFYPTAARVRPSGRVIVLGTPPADAADVAEATAQRALEGFTRSLGKEVGRGATVQLVYVEPATRTRSPRRCASCSPRARPTCPARWSTSRAPTAIPRSTGRARWAAARRWSPARRGASAPRSPRRWSATART
jgi:3-oxoacyl-[acyl-carrier protein] reductase